MQKQLLFILLFSLLLPISNAAERRTIVYNTNAGSEGIYIPLQAGKGGTEKGGIKHAPALQLATAYLQGDLLTVNFTSPAPNATIAISNKLTGEVEYTEVCNTQSTTIYLSMFADYGNTYTIDVSTSTWERYGEFTY